MEPTPLCQKTRHLLLQDDLVLSTFPTICNCSHDSTATATIICNCSHNMQHHVYVILLCNIKEEEEEEEEQHSPVCVIDIEFEEDGESSSSFDQSLASVERARQKLMQKIRRFESLARLAPVNLEEWMSEEENSSSVEDHDEAEEEEGVSCEVEEKARRLLNDVKAATSMGCWRNDEDKLLIDFFRDELSAHRGCRGRNVGFDCELVNRAKSWMKGEHGVWVGWEVEEKRGAHVREMEKQGAGDWCKFEEEREEVGVAVENAVIDALVEELLLDLVSS